MLSQGLKYLGIVYDVISIVQMFRSTRYMGLGVGLLLHTSTRIHTSMGPFTRGLGVESTKTHLQCAPPTGLEPRFIHWWIGTQFRTSTGSELKRVRTLMLTRLLMHAEPQCLAICKSSSSIVITERQNIQQDFHHHPPGFHSQ